MSSSLRASRYWRRSNRLTPGVRAWWKKASGSGVLKDISESTPSSTTITATMAFWPAPPESLAWISSLSVSFGAISLRSGTSLRSIFLRVLAIASETLPIATAGRPRS